jgi:nucleotide-binding universal stress UspA family protein
MVTFTHVLYPTDLSDASLPAFRYAVALARWYGAALTVLHVVPNFDPADPDVQDLPLEDVRAQMARLLPVDPADGVTATFAVREGGTATAIVEQAVESRADLIVMGTHGRSGFSRLLLGSVAEKVLRHAPCPVLTIPHGAFLTADQPSFQRVLCAVDFSPASEQAVGFSLDLARQSGGTVTLLNVVEWLIEEQPVESADYDIAELRAQMATRGRERLQALLSEDGRTAGSAETLVTLGRAHREVVRVAEEQRADTIVMGAQGRGGVGLALFGSTTQQVVRNATCPVLVVHAPGVMS